MSNGKTAIAIVAVTLIVVSAGFAQTLEENWNDFLHYTKIGRFDLATGYAQTILDGNPDPVKLLELSKANAQGYHILLRVNEAAPDAQLAQLTGKILDIIEKGNYIRRVDPRVIVTEVKRLSSTDRGWLTAVKRLRNAGEYAIPFMLDAMADNSRESEFPDIVRALPQIGRDAIRPLAAALQTDNVAVKAQIISALAQIGYPQSAPYLKYIVENDKSAEIRDLAKMGLSRIDPGTLKLSAAQLFFSLAEKYYYHSQSLTPAEDADFANLWFWDADQRTLVRVEVSRDYFNELMAMRCCEWALKSDAGFGPAIGLWLAAFFKAESAGIENMPAYFGDSHADALVYATTAGVEYLHQALARAVKDKNAHVALGAIEALGTTAGEKSLLYRIGPAQPLLEALSFDDIKVRYSAAIAIGAAGPKEPFAESKLVVANLAEALGQNNNQLDQLTADSYALRSAEVMLSLAQSRNPVIDLSLAQNALVSAVNDRRKEMQILSGRILAHIDSPDAQRAIAGMALNTNNDADIRIAAFDSLATSAKLNANMLVDTMVDAVYSLISSDDTDPDIRSAAAAAYGALNLPSQKVKDLILDQAKS
ncbi:MAG: HEAT repeat domain-containing protein [Sedimentisphaerales bacterium]|nr:HEAT repeat domain-containing protein [Sedimentisphaerales bacterium]